MTENESDTTAGQTTNQTIPERFQRDGANVSMGTREDGIIKDDRETTREWIQVVDEGVGDEDDDISLYWFDLKDVSWERKSELVDENLNTDQRTDEVELDIVGYYRDMMEEIIMDKSVDGSLPMFLKGMSHELGDQLQDRMPDPGTMMEDVDEGKSEESSEDE